MSSTLMVILGCALLIVVGLIIGFIIVSSNKRQMSLPRQKYVHNDGSIEYIPKEAHALYKHLVQLCGKNKADEYFNKISTLRELKISAGNTVAGVTYDIGNAFRKELIAEGIYKDIEYEIIAFLN